MRRPASLVFFYKIAVDVFRVAIGAFDPALFVGDLQPDLWMAIHPATVTGNAVFIDNYGFGGFGGHGRSIRQFVGPMITIHSA